MNMIGERLRSMGADCGRIEPERWAVGSMPETLWTETRKGSYSGER
jgi:hypothetical protein